MPFKNDTLKRFTDRLGSHEGSPGGGAAACLTASLGTALVEMVVRINNRRGKVKSTAGLERTRTLFLSLMDNDAKAFRSIMSFSKERRSSSAYQKALRNGAEVPLKAAAAVLAPLETAVSETKRTSAWLFSDLEEAGLLLQASFLAARLNVEINLKAIRDKEYANASRIKLNKMQARVHSLVKKIHLKAKK